MKNSTLLLLFLCCAITLKAQDINPYASIGKEGKIVTLSNGRYQEVQIDDSLQRVGAAILNMNTGKIYKLLDDDSLNSATSIDPTIVSRWYSIDPKASKYPNLSPYASFSNNPILIVDPDGGENIIYLVVMPSSKGYLTNGTAASIAAQATQDFKNMGMNTQVKVFTYGDFNYANLDPTDGVAVLGNVSEIRSFTFSKAGADVYFDQKYTTPISDWDESVDNPERSSSTYRVNHSVIGLDASIIKSNGAYDGADEVTMAAFLIAHGSVHNAGIPDQFQDRNGIYFGSIVTDGGDIQSFINGRIGNPYLPSLHNPNLTSLKDFTTTPNNKPLLPALQKRFGTSPAKDNYTKNMKINAAFHDLDQSVKNWKLK